MQGCHKHSVYKNAVPGKYNKVKDNNIRHAKARKSYAIHYYIQRKKVWLIGPLVNTETESETTTDPSRRILAYKFHSLNNFLWSSY